MARFQSNVYWRAMAAAELTECSMPFYYAWRRDCSPVPPLAVRKQSLVGEGLAETYGFSLRSRPEDVASPGLAAGGIGR
jgi:hypothetical protein